MINIISLLVERSTKERHGVEAMEGGGTVTLGSSWVLSGRYGSSRGSASGASRPVDAMVATRVGPHQSPTDDELSRKTGSCQFAAPTPRG